MRQTFPDQGLLPIHYALRLREDPDAGSADSGMLLFRITRTHLFHAILRAHGVAHVFNAWMRMPELQRQIAMPEAHTAPFTVTRALLRYGRSYEIAVKSFWPYERIQDPIRNPMMH